jgi:apbE family lipoprotein
MHKSIHTATALAALTAVTLSLGLASCSKNISPSQTRPVLGTVCTVQLFEYGKQKYYDTLFERLEQIEAHMSMNIPSSDIARINAASGGQKIAVHEDTFKVIRRALDIAQLSDGAFNPASGALVKLWNIGSDAPHLPSQEEIEGALALCDWRSVVLSEDGEEKSVYLPVKGTALDLGGIAKGFAADELAALIKKLKIPRAIIDLGGNIYAVGEKKGKEAWKVGIKNPFDSAAAPVIALSVKDVSVVTSGVYERFFVYEGRLFHHLLDCKTGYPADNGLMSVTIVNESSMDADALATAVFVMGKERGMDLLRRINTEGLCIDTEKTIDATESIKRQALLLNEEFSIR